MPATVVVAMGTRPEAIKLAPVVRALAARPELRVRILATAQHRRLLDDVLRLFELWPSIDLDLMQAEQSLPDLTARVVVAVDRALAREQPALVMVQGDTTSALATALAAFYRGVPVAHVEAGLRTGRADAPFPEETNRRLLAKLARLHLAPHENARGNLRAEGVPDADIAVVGNPVVDALLWMRPRVDVARFAPRGGRRLVLVTAHRRENFGAPLAQICAAVRDLAERPDVEVLVPVHPNPSVERVVRAELTGVANVRLVDALDYRDFVAAMCAASLILTDSGGVQEEAPSLGKPVLVLRDVTERPEGVEAGYAELVGTDRLRIVAAARAWLDDPRRLVAPAVWRNPYGDGKAAERIAARVGDVVR